MTIYLAADHTGFSLKATLIPYIGTLRDTNGETYQVEDLGARVLDQADDYPDFVTPCATAVAGDIGSYGIIIGASGQGEAMCANRVPGVRAAVYYGVAARKQTDAEGHQLDMLASVRAHNDANMLSLAARFLSEDEAKEAVRVFLSTPFSGAERHQRRLAKF